MQFKASADCKIAPTDLHRRRESGSGPGLTGKRGGSSSGEVAQRSGQCASSVAAAHPPPPAHDSTPSDAAQPDGNADVHPRQAAAPRQGGHATEEQMPTVAAAAPPAEAAAAAEEAEVVPDAPMPDAGEEAAAAGSDPDETPAAAAQPRKVLCFLLQMTRVSAARSCVRCRGYSWLSCCRVVRKVGTMLQCCAQAGAKRKRRGLPAVPPQIRNVRRELQTTSQAGRIPAPRRNEPRQPAAGVAAEKGTSGRRRQQQQDDLDAPLTAQQVAAERRMSLPANAAAGTQEPAAQPGAKRRLSMGAAPAEQGRRPNEYGSANGDPYGRVV